MVKPTTIQRISSAPYAVALQQNSVRWACLVSLAPKRKKEVPLSMAIGNWELMH